MSVLKKLFVKRAIILMAPFLFLSCEKDNGEIGLNQVIGGLAGLEDTTLPIISYTQAVDSILVALDYNTQTALGGYFGNRLLGSRVDPIFGQAKAGIVTQAILAQIDPDFGNNPNVDSVILYLRYNGFYGDTTKPLDIEVYALDEELDRDTNFYSGFQAVRGPKIGEAYNFTPRPNTKSVINDVSTFPTAQINLDTNYFQQYFADVADGDFEAFSSNEDFIEYFKGINIVTTNEDGAMLYFTLPSSNSRIVIYYRNDTDTNTLSLGFAQSTSTKPISFNTFSQDYTNYSTGFNIDMPDSAKPGASTTYVQSMGGVATIIKLDGLMNLLADENIIVNRAFLEVPTKRGLANPFSPASALEIRKWTEAGPGTLVKDFSMEQSAGDGKFRQGGLRNNKYIFELTRHVFEVLNENRNDELAIVPVNKATTANQTILSGGNDPIEEVVLRVYYTKKL